MEPNRGYLGTCFRRPNHSSDIVLDFAKMLEDEEMVDVTLSCEDGSCQAHKMILAANSSYFRAIFSKLSRQQQQYPVVIIKDMSFADLKLIVEFIYRGEISVPNSQLSSLLKSADGLKIKGLTNVNLENLKNPSDHDQERRTKKRRRKKRKSPGDLVEDSMMSQIKEDDDATEEGSSFSTSDDERSEVIVTERLSCSQTSSAIEPSRLMEQTLTIPGDENGISIPRYDGMNSQSSSRADNTENTSQSLSRMSSVSLSNHPHLPQHMTQPLHSSASINFQSGLQFDVMSAIAGPSLMPTVPRMSQDQGFGPPGHHSSVLANLTAEIHKNSLGCHTLPTHPVEIGNGRRHYQCPICLKTFSEKGNMKRHMQIHLQQRNRYMCDLCSKCFSWKDNFNRHRRTAHQISDDNRP